MEDFKSFITESSDEKYKVVVLTRKPEQVGVKPVCATSARIEEEAKKLGIECYVCFIDGAYLTFEDNVRTIHNQDDEKGFPIFSDDTVVIVRGGVNRREVWKDLLTQIERAGITCVNTRACMEMCADKYMTLLTLAEAGLVTPTTVLVPDVKSATKSFEKLNTDYPVILKTNSGTKGVGVLFVESEKGLQGMIQLLFKLDDEIALILQSYIETKFDVRVMILNNKVIGSMKRMIVKNDFRSNYSQGAEIMDYKLNEIEKDACLRAAKLVSGSWVGVDFIPGKSKKDLPYILEVNSSPGTKGIQQATKINVVKELLKEYFDKDYWWKNPTLCGVHETFEHDILGKMIGKMDTGNSNKRSVIHADEYNIKDNTVIWSLNGKKIKSKLVEMKEINLGGFRNRTETRPVIRLDLSFQDKLYKNLLFSLDDRGGKTPILINREFMKLCNLAVDPSRKFILTEKINDKRTKKKISS
jgi:RimK family alpha-L-glutamate ligase